MNETIIRVSVVKYLNSIPFVFGLKKFSRELNIDLQCDTPSQCAARLKNGEADIGLIPVSEIDHIRGGEIVGDYCIGANGPVYSVCLTADRPVNELEQIYMDPHSRTSVNLAKVLAGKFWKKNFEWLEAEDGFELTSIGGKTGGVVIGDKVFGIEGKYKYKYDLAEAWTEMTGLPFVFACWVAAGQLNEDWIGRFNMALETGVNSIPEVLEEFPYQEKLQNVDLADYLMNKISYSLDKQKRAGMALFRNLISETRKQESW